MTDKDDADKYRLAQAQKLIRLFTAANGRPPETEEELIKWVSSREGRTVTARHRDPDGKIIR